MSDARGFLTPAEENDLNDKTGAWIRKFFTSTPQLALGNSYQKHFEQTLNIGKRTSGDTSYFIKHLSKINTENDITKLFESIDSSSDNNKFELLKWAVDADFEIFIDQLIKRIPPSYFTAARCGELLNTFGNKRRVVKRTLESLLALVDRLPSESSIPIIKNCTESFWKSEKSETHYQHDTDVFSLVWKRYANADKEILLSINDETRFSELLDLVSQLNDCQEVVNSIPEKKKLDFIESGILYTCLLVSPPNRSTRSVNLTKLARIIQLLLEAIPVDKRAKFAVNLFKKATKFTDNSASAFLDESAFSAKLLMSFIRDETNRINMPRSNYQAKYTKSQLPADNGKKTRWKIWTPETTSLPDYSTFMALVVFTCLNALGKDEFSKKITLNNIFVGYRAPYTTLLTYCAAGNIDEETVGYLIEQIPDALRAKIIFKVLEDLSYAITNCSVKASGLIACLKKNDELLTAVIKRYLTEPTGETKQRALEIFSGRIELKNVVRDLLLSALNQPAASQKPSPEIPKNHNLYVIINLPWGRNVLHAIMQDWVKANETQNIHSLLSAKNANLTPTTESFFWLANCFLTCWIQNKGEIGEAIKIIVESLPSKNVKLFLTNYDKVNATSFMAQYFPEGTGVAQVGSSNLGLFNSPKPTQSNVTNQSDLATLVMPDYIKR